MTRISKKVAGLFHSDFLLYDMMAGGGKCTLTPPLDSSFAVEFALTSLRKCIVSTAGGGKIVLFLGSMFRHWLENKASIFCADAQLCRSYLSR